MASLFGKVFRMLMVDRSAKNKSLETLTTELANSKQTILDIVTEATDNEANRKQLNHVIGIERWGQNRLKVALGEPLVMDEHDGYCPGTQIPLNDLAEAFTQTRQETLAVATKLLDVPSVATKTVEHNDMGATTIRSWLQYIDMHGTYELRNVK